MIRLHIPGFKDSDIGSDTRLGDAQIIDDGTNYLVIDGYCGNGANVLIKALKTRGIYAPYLLLTHAHYDHYHGLRKIINAKSGNKYVFNPKMLYCYDPSTIKAGTSNNSVKSDYNALKAVISEAKARKIPVTYVKHGDHIKLGDLDFYIYRNQPSKVESDDKNGWAYINDGSICTWFPTIGYMTSGDGPMGIYDMCKSVGAKPVLFKIPHHGNNANAGQANGMKARGAKYCWDNDYSTTITDFLKYGRRRCIEAGIQYFNIHGDINVIFKSKEAVIYKDGKSYKYKISYNGKSTLKGATATVVRKTMQGKFGSGNTRITKLINAGRYPIAVQNKLNSVLSIANAIKKGTEQGKAYGKNEERISNIDKELGKGYGQLVQDYINVLCGIRESV